MNELLANFDFNCERCFDTGVWLTPLNAVEVCPKIQLGEIHAETNKGADLIKRSTALLKANRTWISPQVFDFARILSNYTSENPCPRQSLDFYFFDGTNLTAENKLRKLHGIVEELRKVWLLPVGSRKFEPSGYWIITELEDFKVWFNSVKAAPITQLTTIHKVAKHNFPVFAEQIELEFRNDFPGEVKNDAD